MCQCPKTPAMAVVIKIVGWVARKVRAVKEGAYL